MILKDIIKHIYRLFNNFYHKIFKFNTITYWRNRAKKYGDRAVLNLAHGVDEYQKITEYQKQILFPILSNELNKSEKLVLDFGCGPGRFSNDLSKLINGKCIGVDPIEIFFDKNMLINNNVEFKVNYNNIIPLENESVDIIWICLVLGGITTKKKLNKTISELYRVLKKEGLIFLVENVSDKKSGNYWIYRSLESYKTLFSQVCTLFEKGFYFDNDEKISIMAGRKGIFI